MRGLAEKANAVSQSRMGRPPLKQDSETKITAVRLTADIRERIRRLVGENKMADFVREAVKNELERRKG